MRWISAVLVAGSIILLGFSGCLASRVQDEYKSAKQTLNTALREVNIATVSAAAGLSPQVSEVQRARAILWYSDQGLDIEALRALPERQRARAVTFLAYNFCNSGDGTPTDLNDLYASCLTQCGGYAYLARGLAAAVDLDSRYVNLYNIPQQGNHTATRLFVEGRWAFYDPTFGAFFTRSGEPDDEPLSIVEISAQSDDDLKRNVVQAIRGVPLAQFASPDAWSGEFEHDYMDRQNYREPESILMSEPDEALFLKVPLTEGTFGMFDATERADLSMAWLQYTNATLNDDIPSNDTSYVAHNLNRSQYEKVILLDLVDLSPGRISVKARTINPGNPQRLQVSVAGKAARLLSERIVPVPNGASVIDIKIDVFETNAVAILRNMDSGTVEIFAYKVEHVAESWTQ